MQFKSIPLPPADKEASSSDRLHETAINIQGIPVSAYTDGSSDRISANLICDPSPLAIWFLENFWRICHETNRNNKDWICAHSMPYAGQGSAWPPITIYRHEGCLRYELFSHGHSVPQSVKFLLEEEDLRGLKTPLDQFQEAWLLWIKSLIQSNHINNRDYIEELYAQIQTDLSIPHFAQYRRKEARKGHAYLFHPITASDA